MKWEMTPLSIHTHYSVLLFGTIQIPVTGFPGSP